MLEIEPNEEIKTNRGFKISLIGRNSEIIYNERINALIGISPFNSYFSEERIMSIIEWARKEFKTINIFIPDHISIYTLKAIGYSEKKAEFKAKRQDRYLKNKVFRALKRIGFQEDIIRNLVVFWSELADTPRYMDIFNSCLNSFENDEQFRNGCLSTSAWILERNSNDLNIENIYQAVQYFLREMPLFVDTPSILGVHSSLFVYHSIPKYLEELYEKSSKISVKQGFLKLEV